MHPTSMARLFGVQLTLLAGCASQDVKIYNTPPDASIVSPTDGELFDLGEPVHFEGLVTDSQDEPNDLEVIWESSIDGPMDDDAADSAGLASFDSSVLSSGTHTIALNVTDTEGETAVNRVEITVGNTAGAAGKPSVTIDGPAEDDVFLTTDTINVIGQATDDQQPWETLSTSVYSGRDGLLWEGNPNEDGIVDVEVSGLTVGSHTLSLRAVDADANSESADVRIDVVADARPGAVISTPADGDWFWITDTIVFQGVISDDLDDPPDMLVAWESDIDGGLGGMPANMDGVVNNSAVLSPGLHTITLLAVDAEGNEGTSQVYIEVRDPLNHDGDLDGYTELEGDCDDADPYTHPAAIDICDAADNDCDGEINEDDWDDWEPGTIDAGEIDHSVSTESWTVSGLTLHSSVDEDWVYFSVDDDWWLEDLNINVEVMTMPATGTYIVELYWTDESTTTPVDSQIGSGRLTVGYVGDPFDDDEDNWAVRVYASSWPSGTCERAYSISITR